MNWIIKITGRRLSNAAHEIEIFNKIKAVRNHLTHFDPPVFAYTIEDVADWLSSINEIGMLLLKIRETLNVNISEQILEMILLPRVKFVPADPGKKQRA
ncbi:MAG: hypothetical protein LBU51_01975 [Bacteroidales bacterium]|jgi:hypothetical protein|nr:hypothetical protein [Bacteroidales bacterium]